MDSRATLPATHNLLLLGSLLSDTDLFEVTVTKVLQLQLDVLLHCVRFLFSVINYVMSSLQNNMLLRLFYIPWI